MVCKHCLGRLTVTTLLTWYLIVDMDFDLKHVHTNPAGFFKKQSHLN